MAKFTDPTLLTSTRRKLERTALAGLLVFACVGFEPSARADFIVNGTFTTTTGISGAGGGLDTVGDYTGGGSIGSWTVADVTSGSGSSTGFALLYEAGNQGSTTTAGQGVTLTGRFGNFSVFDPGNVAGATPHSGAIPNTSPGGGNFIAADASSSYNVAIYQSLTGLAPNTTYAVSFWYAAAQQSGFTGNTTEGWQVSLESGAQTTQVTANGTTIQDTPTQAIVPGTSTPGLISGGFQSWAQDTLLFTTSSSTTSEILTFLSIGTPTGEPPISLLSDVVMVATPEPASLALSGFGMASLIGIVWFRRNRVRKALAVLDRGSLRS